MSDEKYQEQEREAAQFFGLMRYFREEQLVLNRRLLELAYPDADTNLIDRLLERAAPEEEQTTAMEDFFDANPEWRD